MSGKKTVGIEGLEGRVMFAAAPQIVGVYADNRGWVELRADQALDASTVTASSVKVYTAGTDGLFGTADDTAVSAAASYDPATFAITANTSLALGTAYRVTVDASVVRAANGGAFLDGEYNAAGQPSGDGVAGGNFDMVAQPGPSHVARFVTVLGEMFVNLDAVHAPLTVANFETYANAGDWDGTFFHRSDPGFVIQGGGYDVTPGNSVGDVPELPPVVNEPGLSNVRGTIAMAKLDNQPDSATNQWFFNLEDTNAANLDAQNGGFTVFGAVADDASLAVMDHVATLDRVNAGGDFATLPVLDRTAVVNRGSVSPQDDLVIVSRVSMLMDATPTPAGDLTTDVSAVNAAITSGSGGSVTVTIRNVGPGVIDGTPLVGLYLSSDGTIDGGDTLLASPQVPLSLAVGQSTTVTIDFTIPEDTTAGQYSLIARADVAGAVRETSATNNDAATGVTVTDPPSDPLPPGYPIDPQPPSDPQPPGDPQPPSNPQPPPAIGDLAVSVTNVSTSAFVPGGTGTITLLVQNVSATAVSGTANVGLYLSSDATIDGGDAGLAFSQVPVTLSAGDSTRVTLDFTVPAGVPAGSYKILGAVNADGAIAETTLANNVAPADVTVAAPTVSVTVKGFGKVKRGKSGKVTVTVTNLSTPLLTGAMNLSLFVTTDPAGTGGTPFGSKVLKLKLKKGKGGKATFTVKVPKNFMVGTYYVAVRADGTRLSAPMAQVVTRVTGGFAVA